MNNSIIKINQNGTYTDATVEANIQSKHTEYLNEAIQWGATCAIHKSINDQTVLPILTETIYRSYDELNTECHKKLDGTLGIAQAKLDINKLNDEINEHYIEKEECEKNYQMEKHRVGKVDIPKYPYSRLITGLLMAFIVIAFDSYFLGTAFQLVGSSFGISLLIGLVISITIAIVSIFGSRRCEKFKEKWKRYLGYFLLALAIGSGIYVLCEMREKYIQLQSGHEISAWKMMLLNMLAFLAFHLIYKFRIAQALETIKQRKEAFLKLQHLKRLKEKLDKIKQTISDKLGSINQIKQFRLSVLSYAKATETKISKLYRQSVSEYKKSYILKSGNVPNCFTTEAPDLTEFYTQYEITPKIHENNEN